MLPDLLAIGDNYTHEYQDMGGMLSAGGTPDAASLVLSHIKLILWILTGLIFLGFALTVWWVIRTDKGLRARAPWARRSALWLSYLALPSTMLPLGLFGIWLFTRPEVKAMFEPPDSARPKREHPPQEPPPSGSGGQGIFVGR